jgi:hypothetical protein
MQILLYTQEQMQTAKCIKPEYMQSAKHVHYVQANIYALNFQMHYHHLQLCNLQ